MSVVHVAAADVAREQPKVNWSWTWLGEGAPHRGTCTVSHTITHVATIAWRATAAIDVRLRNALI